MIGLIGYSTLCSLTSMEIIKSVSICLRKDTSGSCFYLRKKYFVMFFAWFHHHLFIYLKWHLHITYSYRKCEFLQTYSNHLNDIGFFFIFLTLLPPVFPPSWSHSSANRNLHYLTIWGMQFNSILLSAGDQRARLCFTFTRSLKPWRLFLLCSPFLLKRISFIVVS